MTRLWLLSRQTRNLDTQIQVMQPTMTRNLHAA